ncbi:MAG: hypothetical protein ACE5QW_00995 [Thermoplasmata archaeon]
MKDRELLQIDCTGCDVQPDLRRHECFVGVLLSFDSKLNIERIILSGTVVKQYSKKSINLFSKMRSILDTLSTLKGELNQRFQAEKSRKELKHCSRCQRDPRKLFGGIEIAFLRDLAEFFSSLRSVLDVSMEDAPPRCELCLLQLKRDALILLDEALSLRKYALKEGLGIVEG